MTGSHIIFVDYLERTTWVTTDPAEADLIILDACVTGVSARHVKTFLPHIHANPILANLFQQRPEKFIMIITFDLGVCNREGVARHSDVEQTRHHVYNITGNATLFLNHVGHCVLNMSMEYLIESSP